MTRRPSRRRSRGAGADVDELQTVVVCRGGDCGNRTKHPGFDHLGQLRRVRGEVDTTQARVVSSGCLDACEHSNVVVVVPGSAGRAHGAAPVWLGGVLDDACTGDVVGWVNAGGPAVADEPVLVDLHTFHPTRLNRHELEEELGS